MPEVWHGHKTVAKLRERWALGAEQVYRPTVNLLDGRLLVDDRHPDAQQPSNRRDRSYNRESAGQFRVQDVLSRDELGESGSRLEAPVARKRGHPTNLECALF